MAVHTVSDYAVLSSGRVELTKNEVKRFGFDRPANFVAGKNLAKPVLMYQAKADGSTKFEIVAGVNQHVVDVEIGTGDNDDEQLRTLHQPIDGELFETSAPHVTFRVVFGKLRISNVVLLHQVRVDTAA